VAQQQVVVSQPAQSVATATPLPNGTMVISQAPPMASQPTVVVTRPERPSTNHVWLEGYWTWRNDRYEWIPAHWQERPYADAEWMPPRWEKRDDGNYTFYEGHWE
jgi:hypothetical protein